MVLVGSVAESPRFRGQLMDAVRYVFSNCANFKGRTDRPTFWWWVLALFILFFVLNLVDAALMGGF